MDEFEKWMTSGLKYKKLIFGDCKKLMAKKSWNLVILMNY